MFHCPDEWGLYQFFRKKQRRLFGIGSSICISRNSLFLQKSAGLWVLFAWLWLTMASRSPEMSWRMDLRRSKGHKDLNEDGTNFKTEVIETSMYIIPRSQLTTLYILRGWPSFLWVKSSKTWVISVLGTYAGETLPNGTWAFWWI